MSANRRPLGYVPAVMDEREAFSNLIEALSIAQAASRQMGYMRGESDWIRMAQQFGTLRTMCTALATRPRTRDVHDIALIGVKQ